MRRKAKKKDAVRATFVGVEQQFFVSSREVGLNVVAVRNPKWELTEVRMRQASDLIWLSRESAIALRDLLIREFAGAEK